LTSPEEEEGRGLKTTSLRRGNRCQAVSEPTAHCITECGIVLWNYANNQERHRRAGSAMPENVVHFAFVIGDTGREHAPACGIFRHGHHWEYLDTDMDDSARIEEEMFDKQVKCDEGVLPKLHLNRYLALYEVCLFE
jgi:hypothetical protein